MLWRKKRWDVLVKLLEGHPHAVGAEIGVFRGKNARQLLSRLPQLEKLYCVDPWQSSVEYERLALRRPGLEPGPTNFEEVFRSFQEAIEPFADRVVPLRMSSMEAAAHVPEQSLDFAFIDAVHTYEFVKQDIELWMLKLRHGGLISGHDYTDSEKKSLWGVKRAVDELFGGRARLGADSTWSAFKGQR